MKRVFVFFILAIFFAGLTFYLVQNTSPFDISKLEELVISNDIPQGEWALLNSAIDDVISRGLLFEYLATNAYLAFLTALSSIFSLFVMLHLIIDKLFFKNFYQRASLFNAIRRGILVVVSIALMIYMHFTKTETYLIILVPVVALAAELIFNSYIRHEKKKPEDETPNKNESDRTL